MKLAGLVIYAVLGASIHGAEHRVASAAELDLLSTSLLPGDVVWMQDGRWSDSIVQFRARGTAEKPITLRATTPGKVLLTGTSSLTIDGEHLVVRGVWLDQTDARHSAVTLRGSHCRLTESAVTNANAKFFVHLSGRFHRVDHSYFAGKTSESPTLQIEAPPVPGEHRIDRNHFGPRPPLRRNGGETIRIGYSGQSMNSSRTLIEENLFDRCDGENEIISNKSCDNVYRANSFVDCAGMLTLRHGNRCLVEGNFFFGRRKRGSGGIRVIGEDHTVINNYIESVDHGGIWITAGIPQSPLNGYFRARNCLIAFNTIIDARGFALDLNAGFGTSGRSLLPEEIMIANNLFSVPSDGVALKGTEGKGFRWIGNVAANERAAEPDHPGIRKMQIELRRGAGGLWRPGPESPSRGVADGATEAALAAIRTDIDGQERLGQVDVGCDQFSRDAIARSPLTAAEVGPSWMNRSALPNRELSSARDE